MICGLDAPTCFMYNVLSFNGSGDMDKWDVLILIYCTGAGALLGGMLL